MSGNELDTMACSFRSQYAFSKSSWRRYNQPALAARLSRNCHAPSIGSAENGERDDFKRILDFLKVTPSTREMPREFASAGQESILASENVIGYLTVGSGKSVVMRDLPGMPA